MVDSTAGLSQRLVADLFSTWLASRGQRASLPSGCGHGPSIENDISTVTRPPVKITIWYLYQWPYRIIPPCPWYNLCACGSRPSQSIISDHKDKGANPIILSWVLGDALRVLRGQGQAAEGLVETKPSWPLCGWIILVNLHLNHHRLFQIEPSSFICGWASFINLQLNHLHKFAAQLSL